MANESEAFERAWFPAAVLASADDDREAADLPAEVIISVSLDELDGLTGDMLV